MKIIFLLFFFLILFLPIQAFAQNPDWVRNVAYWWSQDQVSDAEFNEAIKFLIENNIIIIDNQNSFFTNSVVDRGDFYATYKPSSKYSEIAAWLQENEEWTLNISSINQVKLPYDFEISFAECGTINAYYTGENILFCYELVEEMIYIQSKYYSTEEDIRYAVQDNIYFIFLHELGHALIHMYEIPYTGKQEDSVDQLATILLLEEGQQGVDALSATSNFWYEGGQYQTGKESLYYHDSHSLDMQRFYSILCFVVGSDPDNYGYLIDIVPVDEASAYEWGGYCISEYDYVSKSWYTFLNPILN